MRDWRALVRARLADIGLRPVDEIDVAEEIAQHIEDRYRQLCADGRPEDEAADLSLRELEGDQLASDLNDAFNL